MLFILLCISDLKISEAKRVKRTFRLLLVVSFSPILFSTIPSVLSYGSFITTYPIRSTWQSILTKNENSFYAEKPLYSEFKCRSSCHSLFTHTLEVLPLNTFPFPTCKVRVHDFPRHWDYMANYLLSCRKITIPSLQRWEQ